jgi:hypothetical protein
MSPTHPFLLYSDTPSLPSRSEHLLPAMVEILATSPVKLSAADECQRLLECGFMKQDVSEMLSEAIASAKLQRGTV